MTARSMPVRRAPRVALLDRLLTARIAVSWELAIYVALFAVAFGLRFWDLGARALHHDESIHAQWSWGLIQGNYRHDPVFHGPLYYHAQGLVFLVFGASDYTARLSPAIFGMALVSLPLLLRRWLGPVGTIAAVAFLTFSPTVVYYSRFLREDVYMAFFILAMAAALWRYMADGRERWLFMFALAFTGSMATKEATYLVVAVFLVYLDLLVAAELTAQSMAANEQSSRGRRIAGVAFTAPFAWMVVSLWPFAARVRRSFSWSTLPRSGDLLIVLGTLTLPLLTGIMGPVLEEAWIVEKGRLVCRADMPRRDAMAIGGLFAITISGAAFVGLQWRPRTWALIAGTCAFLYLTLFTSLWTNANGLCTGPWGGLNYWWSQHDVVRGDQPWFYYFLLLPAYEFLPLVICFGGMWWSLWRGNAFSRFLWVWFGGTWLSLSWAGEKMPWLNMHLAAPACVLAAWTVQRAWTAFSDGAGEATRRAALPLVSAAVVGAGGVVLAAYLPGSGPLAALARVGIVLFAGAVVFWSSQPFGRRALGAFAVVAVVGGLAFFSLKAMVGASFERGDVPKDMLIYTQSAPDIPRLMTQIDALAEATGLGYDMPILVDSMDSFAWPWAWYLRDYRRVGYIDLSQGPLPAGDYRVLLVNQANIPKTDGALAERTTGPEFQKAVPYPHRWWFDEVYKAAMDTGHGSCTARAGDCGPFKPGTWEHIVSNLGLSEWPRTWLHYIRDHDLGGTIPHDSVRPCGSCGSVNAAAYFPVDWDMKTRSLVLRDVSAPKPTVDAAGRPMFGGFGRLPGQFSAPVDIERDAQGNLYVIDSTSKRLQKFDASGNFLATADIRVNPGDANEGSQPWGLAVAPDGTVVVADTFGWRIRTFTAELVPTGVTFGKAPNPDPAVKPGDFDLYGPRDVAFDRQGNMWVTDGGHDRIVVYTLKGEFVRAIGGTGTGPGQFDEPVGITAAADGTFYVADMFNGRVVALNQDGSYRSEFRVEGWGGKGVDDKPYLRALRDGRIAVGLPSLNTVRIYDSAGTVKGTVTGDGDPLTRPYGIVETLDGKLWIVEGGIGRVRQFPIP
ncbi:MAG: TIGR03663 family protein [Dehalococcoidia bacterium]